jgi:hypothetical protein
MPDMSVESINGAGAAPITSSAGRRLIQEQIDRLSQQPGAQRPSRPAAAAETDQASLSQSARVGLPETEPIADQNGAAAQLDQTRNTILGNPQQNGVLKLHNSGVLQALFLTQP